MKVFEITGKLLVTADVQTHERMLNIFYKMLKENGFFFVGESKDITNEYITED